MSRGASGSAGAAGTSPMTPFLSCAMEPRTPPPRRPQARHKRFVAVFVLVFALFGLLGGDPRRGLDLPGHFSEDHGKTSRSSHTSKEVDARWSTRATKHIGEEYLGNMREGSRAGERERERGAGIRRKIGRSKLASMFSSITSITTPPGAKGIPTNKGASDE